MLKSIGRDFYVFENGDVRKIDNEVFHIGKVDWKNVAVACAPNKECAKEAFDVFFIHGYDIDGISHWNSDIFLDADGNKTTHVDAIYWSKYLSKIATNLKKQS